MRTAICVHRPFHAAMLANSLDRLSSEVDLYTSATRKYFHNLSPQVRLHLCPAPVSILARLTPFRLPQWTERIEPLIFDRAVSARMSPADLFIGWATQCLHTAREAKRSGAFFALDRACPHLDFQEQIVQAEAEKNGAVPTVQPAWYRERQLQEYETADAILVPSDYTARSFPAHLQPKLLKAPLLGRCSFPDKFRTERNEVFTVGVVGGDPLRKGYRYLLRAWQRLALPNARLLLRTGSDFSAYPVLKELLGTLRNVEFVGYVPSISDFYQRCDVFVLPSVDDGFGMALMEAMANRRPCVATTNCGATDLLKAGEDALVVEPANEEALADALLRLYQSEELRQSIAEAGQLRARRIAAAGLYDNAIRELLEKASGFASAESVPALHA